jgi:hypothetical protein
MAPWGLLQVGDFQLCHGLLQNWWIAVRTGEPDQSKKSQVSLLKKRPDPNAINLRYKY